MAFTLRCRARRASIEGCGVVVVPLLVGSCFEALLRKAPQHEDVNRAWLCKAPQHEELGKDGRNQRP